MGVELEARFVDLGRQNFALHAQRWENGGLPAPVLLQGDSRGFAALVGQAAGIVTSPPYANQVVRDRDAGTHEPNRQGTMRGGTHSCDAYGSTLGNLGNLPDRGFDGIVTSPPYEKSDARTPGPCLALACEKYGVGTSHHKQDWTPGEGNLGNDAGDTYWQAVAEVYRQCLIALRPGGTLVVVVKGYVKAGKLVPLPDQTHELLLHLGFEPVERVRALLVKETVTAGLFGDITERTARKSFFRRLAEKKAAAKELWATMDENAQATFMGTAEATLSRDADPKKLLAKAQMLALDEWEAVNGHWASESDIDWEDVLFVRKPT